MRFTGLRPIEKGGLKGFGFSIHFDNPEKPGSSSSPVTAAPGANPSQALGAPVEPGAAGANATAASFSGRE